MTSHMGMKKQDIHLFRYMNPTPFPCTYQVSDRQTLEDTAPFSVPLSNMNLGANYFIKIQMSKGKAIVEGGAMVFCFVLLNPWISFGGNADYLELWRLLITS